MPSVEESFDYCRSLTRARARNFFYSFLLLPREEKNAMCAVYAFMRRADDISDEADQTRDVRRERLRNWRTSFERALEGAYGDDPIRPAFHATVQRYRIPPEYFFELLEGVASDLDTNHYRTFDDLYRYCYRVASVVGMTTMHVFGCRSDDALALAEKCGVAFQLTNILRDIPEDAKLGRVYLPQEDLAQFDVKAEDLIRGRTSSRFRALMEFEWNRADQYYQQAIPLLRMVRPRCRAALWAMVSIYYRILRRIRSLDYNVFARRARLSGLEKSWIVLRAFKLRFLGGAPPFPA